MCGVQRKRIQTIQVVNCLAYRMRRSPCRVFDGPHNLISNTIVHQLIVTGCSADALFHLSGETAGRPS